MTPDPIGLNGGINLYLYAGANPVNYIDPLGLCRKAGEGYMECVDRKAEEAFGPLLSICDAAGYYGLGSMAIAAGASALQSAGNYVAKTGANNANAAGAYTRGHILKKQAAATAGAKVGGRISTLKATLGAVGRASGVIGASGTIGSLGMRSPFLGECMEQCDDDCSSK